MRLLLYYNSTIPNWGFHILWWVIFMWKYLSVGELKDEILWVCQILTHFLYLHDDSWKTASRKDYQKKEISHHIIVIGKRGKTCEWTKNVSLLTAKTTHLTGQLGSPSSALTSWQSLNISRYDWSCPDLRDISSFPKWAAGRRGSSKMPSIPISEDCCHGQHLQACLEHWQDVSIFNF